MTRSKKSPTKKKTVRAPKGGNATNDVAKSDVAAPKALDPRIPPAGTVIERPYKGKTLKLKVLDAGFEFAGKEFSSVSAAARAATGAASINGLLFWRLIPDAAAPKGPRTPKPATPTLGGETADLSTPEGQRAALAEAGITKRGRPIGKPRGDGSAPTEATEPTATTAPKPRKGTPAQAASAAKARAARAAKKTERTAR